MFTLLKIIWIFSLVTIDVTWLQKNTTKRKSNVCFFSKGTREKIWYLKATFWITRKTGSRVRKKPQWSRTIHNMKSISIWQLKIYWVSRALKLWCWCFFWRSNFTLSSTRKNGTFHLFITPTLGSEKILSYSVAVCSISYKIQNGLSIQSEFFSFAQNILLSQ